MNDADLREAVGELVAMIEGEVAAIESSDISDMFQAILDARRDTWLATDPDAVIEWNMNMAAAKELFFMAGEAVEPGRGDDLRARWATFEAIGTEMAEAATH